MYMYHSILYCAIPTQSMFMYVLVTDLSSVVVCSCLWAGLIDMVCSIKKTALMDSDSAAIMAVGGEDLFKEEFKRYKKRIGVDLKDVIDFRHPDKFRTEISQVSISEQQPERCGCRLGLKPTQEWDMYTLSSVPGLLVIPNPFLAGGQHQWVWQCLVTYPCKPSICNLDAHMERPGDGRLWPHHTSEDQHMTESTTAAVDVSDTRPRDQRETGCSTTEFASPLKRARLSEERSVDRNSPLYKLRWVTLGYHYDWSTKEYRSDRKSPFPEHLADLSEFILEVAGFHKFVAEAGIVNYYHLDSTLSGHTDHSEKDLTRPLLSISFAQSAIFLIGGKTKQVRPKALLLNSGDVVIMSCDSRLAYHGIPKVLPPPTTGEQEPVPLCLSMEILAQYPLHSCVCRSNSVQTQHKGEHVLKNWPSHQQLMEAWSNFIPYLSLSRINVNVRQVISDSYNFK